MNLNKTPAHLVDKPNGTLKLTLREVSLKTTVPIITAQQQRAILSRLFRINQITIEELQALSPPVTPEELREEQEAEARERALRKFLRDSKDDPVLDRD